MTEKLMVSPPTGTDALITLSQYEKMYTRSIKDPQNFWSEQAEKFITWFKRWDTVLSGDFKDADIQWFANAKLNASYNCVDRHLETKGNQLAIIWESDDGKENLNITYTQLHEKVCRLANVLKKHGVKKGDRVSIYMPMIPEAIYAMLACVRIGAIHSVVFGGFSPESIKTRVLDADCRFIITADESLRGGKIIPLKKNIDEAISSCPNVKKILVVKRSNNTISWNKDRDLWYHEEIAAVNSSCPAEIMNADDPLFILYTSGSTGKPKGILHTHAGYLVYVAMTFKFIFNYQPGDIHWCTADIGWITGHSYLVYGPLCNGATILLYEGIPNYPTASRCWEIVDKYNVNIFYTAPTALRALRHEGNSFIECTKRKSLKILGSVGEPINPEVWSWYSETVGDNHCPIVDTWWQTETGGILISPIPYLTPLKPGSAAWPFFGIWAEVVDDKGDAVPENQMGKLVIKQPWPGMMKTVYGDQKRFHETYFKEIPNAYLTGDNAHRDSEGYFWITGRNDDVIKVSGHRISSEEVESALVSDASVSEAAVVAIPHEIKGECIYAFVILNSDVKASAALKKALIKKVREVIGPIAAPEFIQFAEVLPKTRSGKIMRRLLRKIATNDTKDLGDLSTLADETVIDKLIKKRVT